MNELENIDDDLDREGIVIIRIDNDAEAKEYGIDHLPALIYFEDKIPAIYEGKTVSYRITIKPMNIERYNWRPFIFSLLCGLNLEPDRPSQYFPIIFYKI